MDFTIFQNDFKLFIDKFGLISPYQSGISSGNGIRYTAEYVVSLLETFNYASGVIDTEVNRINESVLKCQVQPGLYKRTPDDGRLEAPDDYVGLGTISNLINHNIALDILKYGKEHKCFLVIPYIYNNCEPGKWNIGAWLGRQQQVICHLQFAAGIKPALWRKIWWCGAIYLSTKSDVKDQDAYVLSWHLVKTAKGKSWLCDKFINYWKKKQEKRGLKISQVLKDYFGFDHPLTKYLQNDTI